ncbi:ATP-binding protein [Caulobacter segnis]|uniref:ATP-binding protein n=1 Tax=Caulobacter segnis TaxID=88688 RepID=UPI001CBFF477|nr:ATP-binding protein [Caulobacter segnis]UAL09072.1 MASE1 domain-containing protein [Caulobacter segnis]
MDDRPEPRPGPSRLGELAAALGLGLAVFALAYVCIELPRRLGHSAPIWLSNAVVLTVLLRTETRRWPLLVVAAATGTFLASFCLRAKPGLAGGLMLANAAEYVFCAWALRRTVGREIAIGRPRDLGLLALFAVCGPLISGVISTATFAVLGVDSLWLRAMSWILSNALGLMALVPCLLALSQARELLAERPLTRRGWLALAALGATALLVFGQNRYPLLFLLPPVLAFVALELEVLGAAVGVVIVGAVAVVFTAFGSGPIGLVSGDLTERALFLQLFLVVAIFSALPLASTSAQRRRLKLEAEAAAHVKAEFLANMSHELRTPLTAMLGFTQLVERQPELSAETRAYVQRVANAGKALRATVNDILDFSKLEAGQVEIKPQAMSPAELTRETVELFTAQARDKGVALRSVGLGDLPPLVEADPDRLRQILLNLIGNAVKFTDHGAVIVATRFETRGSRLVFEVSDTGPGIAAEQSGQLFQRFSQVDGGSTRRSGGTGLGLAICKGLVEAMGGEVGVESTPGAGSRFWFEVPASPVEAPAVEEEDQTAVGLPPGCRVLIVDDNAANRHLVRAILTPFEVDLTEASDGDEGVVEAEARAFDIILMDLRMPRVDGRTATLRIRQGRGPNRTRPILAFSADASAVPVDDLFAGHVAKPLSALGLIAAMATAIADGEPRPEPV